MPSFNLIHSTVWPQYINVTDRTDRQTDRTDNGLMGFNGAFNPRIALGGGGKKTHIEVYES